MNIGSRAGLRARRHWPAQSPALLLTSERRTFEPRTPESRTISSGTSESGIPLCPQDSMVFIITYCFNSKKMLIGLFFIKKHTIY